MNLSRLGRPSFKKKFFVSGVEQIIFDRFKLIPRRQTFEKNKTRRRKGTDDRRRRLHLLNLFLQTFWQILKLFASTYRWAKSFLSKMDSFFICPFSFTVKVCSIKMLADVWFEPRTFHCRKRKCFANWPCFKSSFRLAMKDYNQCRHKPAREAI